MSRQSDRTVDAIGELLDSNAPEGELEEQVHSFVEELEPFGSDSSASEPSRPPKAMMGTANAIARKAPFDRNREMK